MRYIADLHVHSHHARATSKNLNLETLYQWAQVKGINVVGTGDFTHPAWFKILQEKLVPDGTGFYELKNPPKIPAFPGLKTMYTQVRFCLSTEISCIYSYSGRVRKSHHLVYAPDLATVARLNTRLAKIGNLAADGRPILGLSARDLLGIVLSVSDRTHLIPAHIWTPWFSTLGSQSGYDSVLDCFRDLTPAIFALETGLSSDPAMNWQVSQLDQYTMVSNSDAHSPENLGREANVFNTTLAYDAMFQAIKTQKGFEGTLEFFPQEGKYHLDGHRACKVCLQPAQTLQHKGKCPVCDRPLTIGVLHRVKDLADREKPKKPLPAPDFEYIVPLPEIIAQIVQKGAKTKTVQRIFIQLISQFGNEFTLLHHTPIQNIRQYIGPVYATAIHRLRQRLVQTTPGYDGRYGTIHLFEESEKKASKQTQLQL